jgi:hypothetical protein
MFDPRSPYHRRRWHYESDQPLSVAQLIAACSLDARTAALLWLLVERHHSLIVSGPTDPMPGVGKTTTLNARLEFLPVGTTLVYTAGMYEDFDFLAQTEAATTCVLANEVSDHLPIYMWGRVARKFLRLPEEGYAVATSCHADTLRDVLDLLGSDLRLAPADMGRLSVVVNIGLVGRVWPLRRRFLTVNYLREPACADQGAGMPAGGQRAVAPDVLALATWDAGSDTIESATSEALAQLAEDLGLTPAELDAAIVRREACLATLATGRGAGMRATRQAIEELMLAEASGSSQASEDASAGE